MAARTTAREEKQPAKIILSPEGRVINHSLFVKDAYTDPRTNKPGVPGYKIEMAFDPADVEGEGTIEDEFFQAAADHWFGGDFDKAVAAFEKGTLKLPFLDGDALAKKREKKEKPGEAYKGKRVLRANTIYNKDGEDGPGGIQVFDPNVQEIGPANHTEVYNGCYGQMGFVVGFYTQENEEGDDVYATKAYLTAFQKTRDGERFASPKDHSTLFKPVGRDTGASTGRRRRAG